MKCITSGIRHQNRAVRSRRQTERMGVHNRRIGIDVSLIGPELGDFGGGTVVIDLDQGCQSGRRIDIRRREPLADGCIERTVDER